MKQLYVNDTSGVLVDTEGRFIYEVAVFVTFKDISSMHKNVLFSSTKEIKNIVDVIYIGKYVQMTCNLHSAPKQWLIDNGYVTYEEFKKLEKLKPKKNGKQKKVFARPEYSGPIGKTTRTRTKKL